MFINRCGFSKSFLFIEPKIIFLLSNLNILWTKKLFLVATIIFYLFLSRFSAEPHFDVRGEAVRVRVVAHRTPGLGAVAGERSAAGREGMRPSLHLRDGFFRAQSGQTHARPFKASRDKTNRECATSLFHAERDARNCVCSDSQRKLSCISFVRFLDRCKWA